MDYLVIIVLVLAAIGAVVNSLKTGKYDQAKKEGRISDAPTKKCPRCAEMIQQEAKVCRYCGAELS